MPYGTATVLTPAGGWASRQTGTEFLVGTFVEGTRSCPIGENASGSATRQGTPPAMPRGTGVRVPVAERFEPEKIEAPAPDPDATLTPAPGRESGARSGSLDPRFSCRSRMVWDDLTSLPRYESPRLVLRVRNRRPRSPRAPARAPKPTRHALMHDASRRSAPAQRKGPRDAASPVAGASWEPCSGAPV